MNYHFYKQKQTIANKTPHAVFQEYLKYSFAKIGEISNISNIFPKFSPSRGSNLRSYDWKATMLPLR